MREWKRRSGDWKEKLNMNTKEASEKWGCNEKYSTGLLQKRDHPCCL